MSTTLPENWLSIFDRQIALPDIDLDGQEKLHSSHVLIIGMGGLGCSAAQSVLSSGIGKLTIMDGDVVDKSNLPRQTLFCWDDIGLNKATVAANKLSTRIPGCEVNAIEAHYSQDYLDHFTQHKPDIILDCTDSLQSRLLVNQMSQSLGVTLISAAVIRYEGVLYCTTPGPCSACYACIASHFPEAQETCVERGVFTPAAMFLAMVQSVTAILWLLGRPAIPDNTMLFIDTRTLSMHRLQVAKKPDCPDCK
jgi:adenylyltransferase/sulfurtransferase